jgi:hypothetical protein
LKAVNLDSIKSNSMFKKIQIFVLAVATFGNINAQKKIKFRRKTKISCRIGDRPDALGLSLPF